MTVIEFDTIKGFYVFELQELETTFHSHPVIELLFVERGSITLTTEKSMYHNITFTVIDSNVRHKVSGKADDIKVVMVEHHDQQIKEILFSLGIRLKNGVQALNSKQSSLTDLKDLYHRVLHVKDRSKYDSRVQTVVDYLHNHEVSYDKLIATLTQQVHLSESRLSHIFKEDIGISLKRYLLWCRLKSVIGQHLYKKENLFSALIDSGFYDQPHFSKAFKSMLGVSPSKTYNSRTLQF